MYSGAHYLPEEYIKRKNVGSRISFTHGCLFFVSIVLLRVVREEALHLPRYALDLVKIRFGRKSIVQCFSLAIYFQKLRIRNSLYSELSLYSSAIVYSRLAQLEIILLFIY